MMEPLEVAASRPPGTAATPLHRARSMIRNPVVRVLSATAYSAGQGGSGGSRRASTTSARSSGSRGAGSGSSASGSSSLTASSASCGTCSTGSSFGTSSGTSSGSGGTSAVTSSESSSAERSREEETVLYDLREEQEEEGAGALEEEDHDGGKHEGEERDETASDSARSFSWSGSEAEWGKEKWLEMADHFDVQRRPDTKAGWEGRKQKYPELFRSDVSICPSYSQFQVPYCAVCRRRYGRAMRCISRRLAEDVEELALLQTRALDGVRVARCFSLGARPHPPAPDTFSERQRRRVEQLLADGIA